MNLAYQLPNGLTVAIVPDKPEVGGRAWFKIVAKSDGCKLAAAVGETIFLKRAEAEKGKLVVT